MNKLLINNETLIVLPSLAVAIGLNDAIILQQIHYWLTSSTHVIEGRKWIYNSYKEWQKQFPFWSESTIKRTIHTLRDQGLLISENWNAKIDKTKWYTIDYKQIKTVVEPQPELSIDQNDQSIISKWIMEETDLNQAIPEITTENTTKKNIHIVEIINYLNEIVNTFYKASTIRARIRDSFALDDFKKVIDVKQTEWLHDPNRSKYLRPETLCDTKFESYLNQNPFMKRIEEESFDLDDD